MIVYHVFKNSQKFNKYMPNPLEEPLKRWFTLGGVTPLLVSHSPFLNKEGVPPGFFTLFATTNMLLLQKPQNLPKLCYWGKSLYKISYGNINKKPKY